MPGDAPIVVDSAGCGAAMKDYGHLLGTPEARAFAARVHDFSEWLAATGRAAARAAPARGRRPGSRATSVTCRRRTARCGPCSRPPTDLRETDDDGLCCGAGGAYAVSQPELAGEIRDRKVAALRARRRRPSPAQSSRPRTRAASCTSRGAGLDVRHPADLLAEACSMSDCG